LSRRFDGAVGADALAGIRQATAGLPADRAGLRLHGVVGLAAHLGPGGVVWAVAATVLGKVCRPVRAILFDKSPGMNWSLGWHQDRLRSMDRQ
jgi:hypothetical protein